MVSIGNKATLVKSMYCMKCAKCCKEFTCEFDIDTALRFMWTDSKDIKAKDTPFLMWDGRDIKHVTLKRSCTQLECIQGRTYRCKKWNEERPDFCNTYPDHQFYNIETWNIEKIKRVLEEGRKDCPGLESITVEDVIAMLKKRRNEE